MRETDTAVSTAQTTTFDVIVVGGGPAGLTTALYTTRLGHDTAVINRGGGRAAMMQETHNVLGIPEEISGGEFLETGMDQLESYGAEYVRGVVSDVTATDDEFIVTVGDDTYSAAQVVFATGFNDVRPDPPLPRTGRGLHYCLHCDAYMFVDESVYVMGNDDSAAYVAMIMLNFTDDVDLLLRGDEPTWSDETNAMLRAHPIDVVESEIAGMFKDDEDSSWLGGFEFEDGTTREYRGGFAMYGSTYNNDLPASLGCDINDDGTVAVDDHGRTNVDGVYAVGDLTPGHNQVPVALGEGAKAGVAIHMDQRAFPRSLDEIESLGPVSSTDVPAISTALREAARQLRAND